MSFWNGLWLIKYTLYPSFKEDFSYLNRRFSGQNRRFSNSHWEFPLGPPNVKSFWGGEIEFAQPFLMLEISKLQTNRSRHIRNFADKWIYCYSYHLARTKNERWLYLICYIMVFPIMVIFQHWNFSITGTFPKLEFFQHWNFSIVGNFPILEFFQHLIFTVLKVAISFEHSTLLKIRVLSWKCQQFVPWFLTEQTSLI